AIVGSLLGALGAYLLIEPVMGIGFAGDPLLVGAISALGILLSAAVGLFVLRRALSVPAAAILRQA
ncbi:MAG: hypothetical protein KDE35_10990, partial [Geminicoccaceae bacterium]|nr:hypothetical protein [Geminicoccaceae bacterium]